MHDSLSLTFRFVEWSTQSTIDVVVWRALRLKNYCYCRWWFSYGCWVQVGFIYPFFPHGYNVTTWYRKANMRDSNYQILNLVVWILHHWNCYLWGYVYKLVIVFYWMVILHWWGGERCTLDVVKVSVLASSLEMIFLEYFSNCLVIF